MLQQWNQNHGNHKAGTITASDDFNHLILWLACGEDISFPPHGFTKFNVRRENCLSRAILVINGNVHDDYFTWGVWKERVHIWPRVKLYNYNLAV